MKKLTVCGCDIAEYALITKTTPHPAEVTAAEFLQRVIKTACGVELPVLTSAEHGICIGTREASSDVKWDGFRMTTDDKNVYLDGNVPRGTLYAAYDFAEKYIGYRSFTHDCEVIPTEGESDVPCHLDRVDNPTFEERRCDWYLFGKHTDFLNRCRINTDASSAQLKDQHGGSVHSPGGCHSLAYLCPADKYFDEHPEYYALVNGERIPAKDGAGPGQLCLTNPDVLKIVTENLLNQLRENPNLAFAEVSQCDNENYCRCERCAAVDEEEGSHSGTMIRFANAVAEEVEKEFPHIPVRVFAYQYTCVPPKKTRARHNVLVRYCTYEACFRHAIDDPNCKVNSETIYPEMMGWQKMCDQMSVWDYVTNWKSYIAPFPNLYSLRLNGQFFHECHVKHLFEEDLPTNYEGGIWPDLRAYLIGKVLWNPYLSEEEYNTHINEFLAAFYGAGWREIRKYLDLEYRVTEDHCCICKEALDNIFVYPLLPGITQEHRRNYVERTYQTEFPDHGLTGVVNHLDEAIAYFDRAYELAETDLHRERIERGRFSLTFLQLFCTPHDKEKMTAEECAAYDAAVEQYHETKKKYHYFYNIFTEPFNR